MIKIQLVAVLSLDGFVSAPQSDSQWMLHPDRFGFTRLREEADYEIPAEATLSQITGWKKEKRDSSVTYLIEATPRSVSLINGMLRYCLIDELILYTVPFISGGKGVRLFEEEIPESHWEIAGKKEYKHGVQQIVYRRKE